MTSTSAALDIKPVSEPAPLNAAVLELLASRICHDLISPVGAVNNGVEFLEEMGADAGAEAIQLIAHSARQASVRRPSAFAMALAAVMVTSSRKTSRKRSKR